ncbi:MAG: alpha-N-arabinofuranosidase, partial [Planctomycetes bacterium]|nr:alpha-N-arabinofuranosidase [Planctomycetota bacterium]
MARIKVDSDRRLGTVSPLIYGQFIEHLGRCIYGGIYEEGSRLSDEAGFRTDVMEAVRGLRVPIIRWPGGNFVSAYHWEDGIGPKDERPRRWDLAWKTEESNRFGTDEFLAYCRKVGAEPYVCVNTGTGTIEEAAQWVEYCNGSSDTHHADLRRRNGYEEPYGVRWWGIGNEISGDWQIGKRQAKEHAWAAREYAKAMRRVDPTIKLVACGASGVNPTDWNLPLLRSTADLVDAIAVHRYIRRGDYYDMLAQALLAEDDIHIWNTAIDVAMHEAKKSERITIVYDEWNAHPSGRVEGHGRYTFTDALVVATFLNIFQRNCTTVEMANLAQMVNILAPIRTSPEGLFLTPIYHPLALYAEQCGTVALDT